jgi:hypothetical protein
LIASAEVIVPSRFFSFFRRLKLRGVSTPFGGASWELRESDREIVRGLLIYLEGRRVLKTDSADEDYEHVTLSVIEIRKELTTTLQRLHHKSPATEPIRRLRRACEEFLTRYAPAGSFGYDFFVGLGRLRGIFGVELSTLTSASRLPFPAELGALLAPQEDLPDDTPFALPQPPRVIYLDPDPEALPEPIREAWREERARRTRATHTDQEESDSGTEP